MKTNCKLSAQKVLIVLLFATLFNGVISAQVKDTWNLKVSYSSYKSQGSGMGFTLYPNLRAEVNYGLTRYLEVGAYAGAANIKYIDSHISPQYGLNANLHILPLFLEKDLRVDPYVTVKFGGMYMTTPKDSLFITGNHFEYNVGVGLAYYIWRRFGVFAEYSFGKYFTFSDDRSKHLLSTLRYGVSFKF